MRDLLRPVEVARKPGVSRTWLYDAAKSGRIPSVRLGGADGPLRFIEEDVDRGGDMIQELVFVGPRGGRLSRSDITRDDHKEALEAAGLRLSLRLHDLRHTAPATWLAASLPMIYVQRQSRISRRNSARQSGRNRASACASARRPAAMSAPRRHR
jgi:predicted DNA-binding transcriptional regulator AlpA